MLIRGNAGRYYTPPPSIVFFWWAELAERLVVGRRSSGAGSPRGDILFRTAWAGHAGTGAAGRGRNAAPRRQAVIAGPQPRRESNDSPHKPASSVGPPPTPSQTWRGAQAPAGLLLLGGIQSSGAGPRSGPPRVAVFSSRPFSRPGTTFFWTATWSGTQLIRIQRPNSPSRNTAVGNESGGEGERGALNRE